MPSHDVWGSRPPVQRSDELDRILALPRRAQELDGTERARLIVDIMTERYSLGRGVGCRCAEQWPERHAAEGCMHELRLIQALALRDISIVGGLLGPIGVGHGKTLLDLLAPFALMPFAPPGERLLAVLLVPPKLIPQLIDDYDYASQHFRMPTLVIQGRDDTRAGSDPNGPILQVMPYSLLQRAEATAWLTHVKPHVLIVDECHRLRNPKTATTARVDRYMDEHPETRMAAWSGSLTSKSIKDYAHISKWCLKGGSPLPRSFVVTEDWSRAIDPCPNPADPGALLEGLIASGCCQPGENVRAGLRRRIVETVGVVSTKNASVSCRLEIDERPVPSVPREISDAIAEALAFRRPDGEELVTAMQAVECAITIACGFHYKWIYPHCEFPRDTLLVLQWLDARKAWHQELRAKLKRRDEHLDSPALCEHAAERFYGFRPTHKGLPTWGSLTYPDWRKIKHQVKPESVAVRMSDYLVQDAAKWAREHNGIVWYQHRAFGEWLAEVTQLPMYGGGDEAKILLLGDPKQGIQGERGDRSVICSMSAHGTGTNGLQFRFNKMLFCPMPGDPAACEQTLGRVHRAGQPRDIVRAWFYMHTKELRKHLGSALRAALYGEQTIAGEQKLRTGIDLDEFEDLEDEE